MCWTNFGSFLWAHEILLFWPTMVKCVWSAKTKRMQFFTPIINQQWSNVGLAVQSRTKFKLNMLVVQIRNIFCEKKYCELWEPILPAFAIGLKLHFSRLLVIYEWHKIYAGLFMLVICRFYSKYACKCTNSYTQNVWTDLLVFIVIFKCCIFLIGSLKTLLKFTCSRLTMNRKYQRWNQ